MAHEPGLERIPDQPGVYRIRVRGHLPPQWGDWFEGLAITLQDDGSTLLAGPVIDQAALHGILKKIRDLGMPLLSVHSVEAGPHDRFDVKRLDVKNQQDDSS